MILIIIIIIIIIIHYYYYKRPQKTKIFPQKNARFLFFDFIDSSISTLPSTEDPYGLHLSHPGGHQWSYAEGREKNRCKPFQQPRNDGSSKSLIWKNLYKFPQQKTWCLVSLKFWDVVVSFLLRAQVTEKDSSERFKICRFGRGDYDISETHFYNINNK